MVTLTPECGQEFRQVLDPSSQDEIGYFSLSDQNQAEVFFTQVVLHEDRRGEGLGKQIYVAMAEELGIEGRTLVSDPDSFSVSALRVWLSLEKAGLAEKQVTSDEGIIDSRGDVYGVQYRLLHSRLPSAELVGAA